MCPSLPPRHVPAGSGPPTSFLLFSSLPPQPPPLFISAFREAGGWEKNTRFQMRKVMCKGDKISPRSQRSRSKNPTHSHNPNLCSFYCHSCTQQVLPMPPVKRLPSLPTALAPVYTHTPTPSSSLSLYRTAQPLGPSQGGHCYHLVSQEQMACQPAKNWTELGPTIF